MARPIIKRDHIETAVVRVVAEKGLRGCTIQDIAQAAQVSPGLLYRYWPDRDALAADVYRKQYTSLIARLGRESAADGDVRVQLRSIIRGFLRFAEENPIVTRFLLLSQHEFARTVPEEVGVRAFITALLKDAQAAGVLKPISLPLALQLFLGIVLQPVIGHLYGDLAGPLSSHADAIIAAVEQTLFATSTASAMPVAAATVTVSTEG